MYINLPLTRSLSLSLAHSRRRSFTEQRRRFLLFFRRCSVCSCQCTPGKQGFLSKGGGGVKRGGFWGGGGGVKHASLIMNRVLLGDPASRPLQTLISALERQASVTATPTGSLLHPCIFPSVVFQNKTVNEIKQIMACFRSTHS